MKAGELRYSKSRMWQPPHLMVKEYLSLCATTFIEVACNRNFGLILDRQELIYHWDYHIEHHFNYYNFSIVYPMSASENTREYSNPE